MNTLEKEFYNNLTPYIKSNYKFLVAYSGGSDSSVLLNLSSKFIKSENLFAVYVNHKIRADKELNSEIKLCINEAKKLHVTLNVLELEKNAVIKYANKHKCGIEASARKLRYGVLVKFCNDNNINCILTAHHKNDQIETIIMKLLRNGSIKSYSGIRFTSKVGNISIIRPLLNTSKSDILDYIKINNINYSSDSTNNDIKYTRNFVRLVLLPRLLSNPSFNAEKLLNNLRVNEGKIYSNYGEIKENWLKTEKFISVSSELQRQLLFDIWDRKFDGEECPQSLINRVISQSVLISKSPDLKSYSVVSANSAVFTVTPKVIFLNKTEDDFNSLRSEYKVEYSECGDVKRDVFINKVLLEQKICFSSAEPNEVINLKNGKKKVGKLLQELKIPSTLRRFVPVMRLNNEIVAVFGSVFGFNNRVSKDIYSNFNNESIFILVTCRYLPKVLF